MQLEGAKPSDFLRDMDSVNILTHMLKLWIPLIFRGRCRTIMKIPGVSKKTIENSKDLKKIRTRLLDGSDAQLFIDEDTGSVRTDFLNEDEANMLVDECAKDVDPGVLGSTSGLIQKNKVIVLSSGDVELIAKKEGVESKTLVIKDFNKAITTTLGILWTEIGFNHWVGLVLSKKEGRTTIYYTNSLKNHVPKKLGEMLKLFGCGFSAAAPVGAAAAVGSGR
jgi:hypothetical protein